MAMSKTKIEINAVEVMYEDFYKVLKDNYIKPSYHALLDKAMVLNDVSDMEDLRKILHDTYIKLERAYELVNGMMAIDQMVNKEETEVREI